MESSMVRQRVAARRPTSSRRYRRPQQAGRGGLRKIIAFQVVICIILLFMIIIAKNINMTATNFITDQVKIVLNHNIELKNIFTAVDRLAVDIRDSVLPRSSQKEESSVKVPEIFDTSDYDTVQELPESEPTVAMNDDYKKPGYINKGTLAASTENNENYSELDEESGQETSVLAASSEHGEEEAVDILMPVKGTIVTSFGEMRKNTAGNTFKHKGIDISVEEDTDVIAVLEGDVVETGMSPEYGSYVKIEHESSVQTVYANCTVLKTQKGDRVNKGDTVARIETTILSAGRHLHFEVWEDDLAVDPVEYIHVDNR